MRSSALKVPLLVLTLILGGCATLTGYQEPKVEFRELYVKEANLVGATLVFVVDVENTGSRELRVDEVNYKVTLAGQPFASSKIDKQVLVAPQTKVPVEIPLPVRYIDVFARLDQVLSSPQLEYMIEGDAKLSFFRVPFQKKGFVQLRN